MKQQGFKKNIIRLTAILLVAVTALLIVNKALFTHIHINLQGQVVAHSHPFHQDAGDSGKANHHHSAQEFYYYSQLSLLFPVLFLFLVFALFRRMQKYAVQQDYCLSQNHSALHYGRAPPLIL